MMSIVPTRRPWVTGPRLTCAALFVTVLLGSVAAWLPVDTGPLAAACGLRAS